MVRNHLLLPFAMMSCCAGELFTTKPSIQQYGDEFNARGFIELANKATLRQDYLTLYGNFDRFIDMMNSDPSFAQKMFDMESAFLSDPERKSRYCGAPPSYRDPRKHSTKRFSKIYFQFIKEFYDVAASCGCLPTDPGALAFLEGMRKIDYVSKEMFKQVLSNLEQKYPGITAKAYGKHTELTVITKIVRYEQAESGTWGTTPHVDKSALSLILNSDDANDESLWLCEDVFHPRLAKLHKPVRSFSQKSDCTSIILIPGAACLRVEIPLQPTVHGVAPITRPYRHAMISFLLIPDIDMSDIITDFTDPLV